MDPTIDRIDAKGNIREHRMHPTKIGKTACGLKLGQAQTPSGNRKCRRCFPGEKAPPQARLAPLVPPPAGVDVDQSCSSMPTPPSMTACRPTTIPHPKTVYSRTQTSDS